MPLDNPFSWSGVFGHLVYAVNHSGFNGLGQWSTEGSALSIPLPLGTDTITRTYGTSVSDSNRRVTWDQELWSVGVAGVSATVYTLFGRWDLGLDFVAGVQLDIEVLLRNLGAAFLKHKRKTDRAKARKMVDAINALTQVFPSFNVEGRIGLSVGLSEANKAYIRFSSMAGAALNLNLPGEFGIEMTSWDAGGRHWQIAFVDVMQHLPRTL